MKKKIAWLNGISIKRCSLDMYQQSLGIVVIFLYVGISTSIISNLYEMDGNILKIIVSSFYHLLTKILWVHLLQSTFLYINSLELKNSVKDKKLHTTYRRKKQEYNGEGGWGDVVLCQIHPFIIHFNLQWGNWWNFTEKVVHQRLL